MQIAPLIVESFCPTNAIWFFLGIRGSSPLHFLAFSFFRSLTNQLRKVCSKMLGFVPRRSDCRRIQIQAFNCKTFKPSIPMVLQVYLLRSEHQPTPPQVAITFRRQLILQTMVEITYRPLIQIVNHLLEPGRFRTPLI